MTYLLRLSKEHAKAVLCALELYERIAMGQTKYIGEVFEGKNGDWKVQRDQGLEEVCEHLKNILFPDLQSNAYYGIMNEKTGKTAHLCYEVLKSLQHRVSWTERPLKLGDFPGVSHDEPILFPSGVNPRPECANEEGTQLELEKSGYKLAKEFEELLGTTSIKEAVERIKWLKKQAAK